MEVLDEIEESVDMETEDAQPETSETAQLETENDDKLVISPELEEMFVAYKAFIDRLTLIARALTPLTRRGSGLSARTEELGEAAVATDGEERKQLLERRRQLIEEGNEVEAARRPYLALREQLVDEFDQYLQTHYDMTHEEFQELRTGPERETWIAWLAKNQ